MSEKKRRERFEDWADLLVSPAESGVPAYASLFPGRVWGRAYSARLDDVMSEAVAELQEAVPGLSESAAVRFLLAIGIDGLRAVSEYAPSVIEAALRPDDEAGLNACRLAASVSPLLVNAVEAVSEHV